MPPELRSGSNVNPHNSGQATPRDIQAQTAESPSVSKSMPPRRSRQSGRVTGGTEASGKTKRGSGKPGATPANAADLGMQSDYHEPRMRHEAPSFADSPWSGVSHSSNPILGTMRPLGTAPTDADRAKVGLAPASAKPKVVASKKGLPSPEEPAIDIPAAEIFSPEQVWDALLALPSPDSSDIDVDQIRAVIEDTLALAVDCQNVAVIRTLLHLWGNSKDDSVTLSALDLVLQENPGQRETSAFQSLVRSAWADVQTQESNLDPTPMNRARRGSDSSTSSLSSAKSLDVETFAPAIANGPDNKAKSKGEKTASKTAKARNTLLNQSTGHADASASRKRPLEDDDESSEEAAAAAAKRRRMQKEFPDVVAHESSLRSLASSLPSSAASSPAPENPTAQIDGPTSKIKTSKKKQGVSEQTNEPLSDSDDSENHDYCHECNRSGQLLCCDGCEYSFHFSCLDPPLDPENTPEGTWYCPRCAMAHAMGRYVDKVNKLGKKDFSLPMKLRNFFMGARSGEKGVYEDGAPAARFTDRPVRASKTGQYHDEALTKTSETLYGNERPIMCFACGCAADGVRPTLQCDYCPLSFHLDCLDPPMAKPPYQTGNSEKARQNWMCPNHSHHDLFTFSRDEDGNGRFARIRRPRNPRVIDVDVIPDDEAIERETNEDDQGILYRLPARALSREFINRTRLENEQMDHIKERAEDYYEYKKRKYEELCEQVSSYFASRHPAVAQADDATRAIFNSRTQTERDAAINLIDFSKTNETFANDTPDRINLLIDQLKASAPELPKPRDEIESLRQLQELINQRIQRLETAGGDSSTPMVLD